jgi:glucan phosphoethanolaminetransferase (alkaline phosphatase superfamily)
VFEDFNGLPLHPLAVHAAAVFVPLLVVMSLAYALVPRWRARVGWAAVGLAVIAPIAAIVARQSGNALADRLYGGTVEGDLADHQGYGTMTVWVTIGLGVLTLALVWFRRAATTPEWLTIALTVLLVLDAIAAAVYVFLTGDLGSRIHWEPLWQNVTG